jgi:large exoprotein involved in heme utilization and adhesion
VYLLGGEITAEAIGGNGGNVSIDPQFVILNNSQIIARAQVGNGGNITIVSDFFLQSRSLIDASSQFGLPGNVQIESPDLDLSGSLVFLPSSFLGAETQLRPNCAVRLTGSISSFVIVGRGGLAIEPGKIVPSFGLGTTAAAEKADN